MHFISYLPGSCGDILCAIIHPESYKLVEDRIVIDPSLEQLKKVEFVYNYPKFDEFIESVQDRLSLPSHLLYYHIRRNHDIIYIDNSNELVWCNKRLSIIYKNEKEVTNTQEYMVSKRRLEVATAYTDKIITVTDIISGNAVSILSKWINTPLDHKLYDSWLMNINRLFPI